MKLVSRARFGRFAAVGRPLSRVIHVVLQPASHNHTFSILCGAAMLVTAVNARELRR